MPKRTLGIAAYFLEFRDKYKQEPWTLEADTGPASKSGYRVLADYANSRKGKMTRLGELLPSGSYSDSRAVLLHNFVASPGKCCVAGLMEAGEAGLAFAVRDADDKAGNVVFRPKKNHAVTTPLYFRIEMPVGKKYGVALFQTHSHESLKAYFDTDLWNHLSHRTLNPISHKFFNILDKSAIKAFAEQGRLGDVVLVEKGIERSAKTQQALINMGGTTLRPKAYRIETRIRVAGGWKDTFLSTLTGAMGNRKKLLAALPVPGAKHADEVRIQLKTGTKSQTFDLLHPDRSPFHFDITRDVPANLTGDELFARIDQIAQGLAEEVGDYTPHED